MANRLAMDKVHAIKSLEAAGLSARRIARTLSISRKAVRRHLGRQWSKGTKTPTGDAPTGSGDPKDTKAPTGSAHLESPPPEASRSLCRAYREAILAKLEQGLTAQRIYQDLRAEQGFSGKYHSKRRYRNSAEPYMPSPSNYRRGGRSHRHRTTTYVKTNPQKSAA